MAEWPNDRRLAILLERYENCPPVRLKLQEPATLGVEELVTHLGTRGIYGSLPECRLGEAVRARNIQFFFLAVTREYFIWTETALLDDGRFRRFVTRPRLLPGVTRPSSKGVEF